MHPQGFEHAIKASQALEMENLESRVQAELPFRKDFRGQQILAVHLLAHQLSRRIALFGRGAPNVHDLHCRREDDVPACFSQAVAKVGLFGVKEEVLIETADLQKYFSSDGKHRAVEIRYWLWRAVNLPRPADAPQLV